MQDIVTNTHLAGSKVCVDCTYLYLYIYVIYTLCYDCVNHLCVGFRFYIYRRVYCLNPYFCMLRGYIKKLIGENEIKHLLSLMNI